MTKYKSGCDICGAKNNKLLIISHIKPWRDSNNQQKIDLENILLLCPNHDALFDKGFISFNDNGAIIISKDLNESEQAIFGIHDESRLDCVITKQKKEYLKWHREYIFEKYRR